MVRMGVTISKLVLARNQKSPVFRFLRKGKLAVKGVSHLSKQVAYPWMAGPGWVMSF